MSVKPPTIAQQEEQITVGSLIGQAAFLHNALKWSHEDLRHCPHHPLHRLPVWAFCIYENQIQLVGLLFVVPPVGMGTGMCYQKKTKQNKQNMHLVCKFSLFCKMLENVVCHVLSTESNRKWLLVQISEMHNKGWIGAGLGGGGSQGTSWIIIPYWKQAQAKHEEKTNGLKAMAQSDTVKMRTCASLCLQTQELESVVLLTY